MISICTNGPLKQCGGGSNVQRVAADGGKGKVPPKIKKMDNQL